MKVIIHADPGEAGKAEAERVKRKIESRVAQADGIVEVLQALPAEDEPQFVPIDTAVPWTDPHGGNEAT